MSEKNPDADKNVLLCERDRRLLHIIREMKNGELKIIVAKGMPIQAEKIMRNVPL